MTTRPKNTSPHSASLFSIIESFWSLFSLFFLWIFYALRFRQVIVFNRIHHQLLSFFFFAWFFFFFFVPPHPGRAATLNWYVGDYRRVDEATHTHKKDSGYCGISWKHHRTTTSVKMGVWFISRSTHLAPRTTNQMEQFWSTLYITTFTLLHVT